MSNSNDSLALAADVGGTTTRLRFATRAGKVLHTARYDSAAFESLEPIVARFCAETGASAIGAACFGIAGPIEVDSYTGVARARVTNLPWIVDAAALGALLGGVRVRLVNDFQAVGLGIEILGADELVTLQASRAAPQMPRALIGAGTGLGQGVLVWSGDHYEPIGTEGGHADFAPADGEQWALATELRARHGHVSWERLLSGDGLEAIHAFLAQGANVAAMRSAAEITHAALKQTDAIAMRALDMFVRLYGAQAGNLALTVGATGGVYIAGGIAPKIITKLRDGTFIAAFRNKGRMQRLLDAIPVYVVTNPDVGLIGATQAAVRLL